MLAPSIRSRISSPSAEGELLGRVGGERVAAVAALLGVAQHRLGVVGADHDEVELRRAGRRPAQLDRRGPRTSRRRRTTRSAACVASVVQTKRAVCRVSETRTPSRSRRRAARARRGSRRSPRRRRRPAAGRGPRLAEPERDVGRAAAPAHLEVVDQERQRDLVELVDDERVGELAGEGHQVVGGDGTGDDERHGEDPTGGAHERGVRAAREATRR